MDNIIVIGIVIGLTLCLISSFLDKDSTAYKIINCIGWILTAILWILLLINIWFIK